MIPHTLNQYGQFTGKTQQGVEWSILTGDACKILRHFENDIFDCVITSPPYYWLRDYGVENQIGHEDSVQDYVNTIVNTMAEVYRVLSPEGLLFLNLGDTYYSGKGKAHGVDPKSSRRRFGLRAVDKSGGMGLGLERKTMLGMPWRVSLAMTQRNWILRSTIIWNRIHRLRESVEDRPRRSYEYVFMFAKSRYYYFDRQPLKDSHEEDIWSIAASKANNGIDTAPFPEENELPFVRFGAVDAWLTSDVFELGQPRSREAEDAIKDATLIQLKDKPGVQDIQKIHHRLVKLLPADDEYWPRWLYFAEQNGVKVDPCAKAV